MLRQLILLSSSLLLAIPASAALITFTLDQSTISTTNTLPFQIVALYGSTNATGSINTGNFGGVGNGSDTTSAYNWVLVTYNNERFRQLTGTA